MNACNYRPKNPILKATFQMMLKEGESRHANQGGLSNSYCAARDSGVMPAWCSPGTPAFAAAKAGLCNRTRAGVK